MVSETHQLAVRVLAANRRAKLRLCLVGVENDDGAPDVRVELGRVHPRFEEVTSAVEQHVLRPGRSRRLRR